MVSFEVFKEMIKKATAKRAVKKVTATSPKEELVVTQTQERDEAFYKAHKGAREDVIYG